MWAPQSFKYDGPLRPFVKREPEPAMREGCDMRATLPQYGNGATAPYTQDGFSEGSDMHLEQALRKQYSGGEMYQQNPSGVMIHSYAPYLPQGGRHMGPEMYDPRNMYHANAQRQQAGRMPMNMRVMPEMMMMRPGGGPGGSGYDLAAMYGGRVEGMPQKKQMLGMMPMDSYDVGEAVKQRRAGVKERWDHNGTESDEEQVPPKAPATDEASMEKRKRNRIAQKKYRERKKTETSRVHDQLESQKDQLTKMETISSNVVEEHARNAVLHDIQAKKTQEIVALKKMLADLQKIDVKAEASTSVMTPAMRRSLHSQRMQEQPELEGKTEKGIVMDIVGAKFIEDMFPDVVRDMKTEVQGHIHCERRLPLLLNVMQDRLLRSADGPNYSVIFNKSASATPTESDTTTTDTAELTPP